MLRRHELSDQEKDNFSFVYSLFYVTNVKNTFSYLHEDLTQITSNITTRHLISIDDAKNCVESFFKILSK